MNIGLPGTGIGGLFYLLTVFVIFVTEIVAIVTGKGNRERWKIAVEQLLLAITMIAMAFVANYYFSIFLFKKRPIPLPTNLAMTDRAINLYQNHPVLVPVTLLIVVLMVTNFAYLLLKVNKKSVV